VLASRLRLLVVAGLSLALALGALAGCGGGDSGPQTKEGFINDADAVCEGLLDDFADAGAQNPGTPEEVAKANDVLADIYGKLSDRIGKVRLPDSGRERTRAQAYVASVQRGDPIVARLRTVSQAFLRAAKGSDAAALAKAGNDVRVALDAFRAARASSDRLAVQYGLNLCGNLD
jgi:hypothetical protein